MKRFVVILGMHRSGTSLVTQICQYMGVYLGETDELMIATKDNPDGYFENIEISRINDNILHNCGKEWYSLEDVEIDNNSPMVISSKNELKNIIRNLLKKSDVAAVKDPRIAVLLPFWEEVLAEMGIKAEYIWVFRNPLEVSESLRKRNGYSQSYGLLLWIHYNLNIMKFLRDKEYLMVNYDSLLENAKAVRSLMLFFNKDHENHLDEGLRHIIKNKYAHFRCSVQAVKDIEYELLSKLYDTLIKNKVQETDILFWERQYMMDIDKLTSRYVDYKVLENIEYLKTKQIIIYGAGNYGRRAAEMLKKIGVHQFYFCDKDTCKQGRYIMGGKVLAIEEIEDEKNILIIIAIADKEIKREIEQTLSILKGIEFISFFALEKIWIYTAKDYTTMEALTETFSSWYTTLESRGNNIKCACECPVLVYQNGKVGSSTISESLQKVGVKNAHIHRFFFNKDIVGKLILGKGKEEFIKNSNIFQLESSDYVNCVRDRMRSKRIITMVRDPIAVDLSTVFQWIGTGIADRYFAEQIKKGKSFSQIVSELMKTIQNRLFEWFNEELEELTGVNIFSYPFDKDKGYLVVSKDNVEILIMKAEKLSHMEKVIRDFVGNTEFQILNSNMGKDKEYAHIYREIKKDLKLSKEYVDYYYNDNFYMDYFYTKEEQKDFLSKWGKYVKRYE